MLFWQQCTNQPTFYRGIRILEKNNTPYNKEFTIKTLNT